MEIIEIGIRSGQFEAQTGKVTSGVINNRVDQGLIPPLKPSFLENLSK